MLYYRRLLSLLALTGIALLSTPLFGQEATPEADNSAPIQALPEGVISTAPPSLVMVIIVDETMTMNNGSCGGGSCTGGNSIDQLALRGSRSDRPGSDHDKRRHEAVRRLIDLLHADREVNHQVAILRMDYAADPTDWVTNDGAGGAAFVSVGHNADVQAVNELRTTRIDSINTETSGRGADASGAIRLAVGALDSQLQNHGNEAGRKPVILWITDDVPLNGGTAANVPYPGSSYTNLSGWLEAINNMTAAFDTNAIQPFNSRSQCRHNNGRLVTAVFSMGAGNWIDSLGSLVTPTDTDGSSTYELNEVGNFYEDFARRNGWIGINGRPLVWAIDPQFEGSATLSRDFGTAISELVSELRCTISEVPDEIGTQSDQQVFQVEVSNAYRQVRITANSNSPVRVNHLAAGTNEATTLTPDIIAGDGYSINLFNRRDNAGTQWAGTWEITFPGQMGTVFVEFELDLAELTWRVDENRQLLLNPNLPYPVSLVAQHDGVEYPVDDIIAFNVESELRSSTGNTIPLDISAISDRQFLFSIPSEQLTQGTHTISLYIQPKFHLGTVSAERRIQLLPDSYELRFEEQFGFRSVGWRGGVLDCRNGRAIIDAELGLQGSATNWEDLENLYLHARVEAYLPPLDLSATATHSPQMKSAVSTPTPFTVFTYPTPAQAGTAPPHVAHIDCENLPSSDSEQQIQIVAQVQDRQDSEILRFRFTASPTPRPTATPPPTEQILPTPTPERFSSDEALREALDQPLVYMLVASIGAGAAGWIALGFFRRYDEMLLGLRGMGVRVDHEAIEPLLHAPLSWLPGHSARLVAVPLSDDSDTPDSRPPLPLLAITPGARRAALRVTNLVRDMRPFMVNGQLLSPDQAIEFRQERPVVQLISTSETIPFRRYRVELWSWTLGVLKLSPRPLLTTTNIQAEPHLIIFHNPFAAED